MGYANLVYRVAYLRILDLMRKKVNFLASLQQKGYHMNQHLRNYKKLLTPCVVQNVKEHFLEKNIAIGSSSCEQFLISFLSIHSNIILYGQEK